MAAEALFASSVDGRLDERMDQQGGLGSLGGDGAKEGPTMSDESYRHQGIQRTSGYSGEAKGWVGGWVGEPLGI